MRAIYNTCILALFGMWISVLINEMITSVELERAADTENKGLPADSETLKMAKGDDGYTESQIKASRKRVKKISHEISTMVWLGITSLMFLSILIRQQILVLISTVSDLIPIVKNNMMFKETCFISLIMTLLVYSNIGISVPSILFRPHLEYIPGILVYLFLFAVFFPILYFLFCKLFKFYGYKFIVACYITYFVKAISEFVTLDDVNLEKMQPVDISVFTDEVRNYLKEKHLERRVYDEIKKSDNINAALIGWGHFERIEIYGQYDKLDNQEFQSILMHEVGHSQDHSLFKKIAVLFAIKLLEMGIILSLYFCVAEKFSDEIVSKNTAFFILYFTYLMFVTRWMMMFHKLTSQSAENHADIIAKNHNFGQPLANVLYHITIKGNSALKSTFFYNSVKSYHPTIFQRIENLSKNQ